MMVKVVDEESIGLEKMGEFWFCGIKYFHETFPFSLKSTNSPFHLDLKPHMHFVLNQAWIEPLSTFVGNFCLPILLMMNIFSPKYLGSPKRYPK
jgi:hypothetical protein